MTVRLIDADWGTELTDALCAGATNGTPTTRGTKESTGLALRPMSDLVEWVFYGC